MHYQFTFTNGIRKIFKEAWGYRSLVTKQIIQLFTARLSIVDCFFLFAVSVIFRSGLGERLVRMTNLSIASFLRSCYPSNLYNLGIIRTRKSAILNSMTGRVTKVQNEILAGKIFGIMRWSVNKGGSKGFQQKINK